MGNQDPFISWYIYWFNQSPVCNKYPVFAAIPLPAGKLSHSTWPLMPYNGLTQTPGHISLPMWAESGLLPFSNLLERLPPCSSFHMWTRCSHHFDFNTSWLITNPPTTPPGCLSHSAQVPTSCSGWSDTRLWVRINACFALPYLTSLKNKVVEKVRGKEKERFCLPLHKYTYLL